MGLNDSSEVNNRQLLSNAGIKNGAVSTGIQHTKSSFAITTHYTPPNPEIRRSLVDHE
jgi:hypothetical protein